jgi:hypothetical protein
MKLFDIEREGPAALIPRPIDFRNFFEATRAEFSPTEIPDREPDFVSLGRSVYWDMGHGVIRSSDHWSDQNGTRAIASCVWTYAGRCHPGRWETGYAPWSDFTRRVREVPIRAATATDLDLAARIAASGGGIDPADWRSEGQSGCPDWARICPRGTLAAAPAEIFLQGRPDLPRVLTANDAVVKRILSSGEVPLPARISHGLG